MIEGKGGFCVRDKRKGRREGLQEWRVIAFGVLHKQLASVADQPDTSILRRIGRVSGRIIL